MERVAVIGAGIGGLVSATLLAARGIPVTVYEGADGPGGKVRRLPVGSDEIDAGPTVFTMRPVFDEVFAEAGASLDEYAAVRPATIIARHAWGAARLDLHADAAASAEAIGELAGADAAAGYRRFRDAAARVYGLLEGTFLRNSNTNPLGLTARIGPHRVADLIALRPYESLWSVLGEYFPDPRLRQLFGRYSTYCGSSPFKSPSTLMLIAHVEASGVWLIEGGMSSLAAALEAAARRNGAEFRYASPVSEILTNRGRASGVRLATGETVPAAAVIANADPAALAAGRLGATGARAVKAYAAADRSLSAWVWLARAHATGFPLARHNVLFSDDYPAEFRALHAGRLAHEPSLYVCALDREGDHPPGINTPERLQIIMNAPADGDRRTPTAQEIEECTTRMLRSLARAGLSMDPPEAMSVLTPADFEARFPSTGGALYGRASHGWAASFLRQSARTRIPGLYCAGGSTHPGAGVPMAALSARLAVSTLMKDRNSIARSAPRAMPGGMWTPSRTAAASASPSSASSAASSRPIT